MQVVVGPFCRVECKTETQKITQRGLKEVGVVMLRESLGSPGLFKSNLSTAHPSTS